jgi:pimeloyl-ACP methyl ester carboxylesterase
MATTPGGTPDHFLVFVPGILGSKLRDRRTGKIVWLDFSSVPLNPLRWGGWIDGLFKALAYPNPDLEPAGLVDEVVFVPPLFKQEHYGRLAAALQGIGYQIDPPGPGGGAPALYTFPYDWRQDNRISARQLGDSIDRWRANHPGAQAWILAHSMGGMVSRWYIEKLGGKEKVSRLFLVASPWDGAPRSLQVLFDGFQVLFRRRFNVFDIPGRTRTFLRTLPGLYQLLPYKNPFLRRQDNERVDLHDGAGWLGEQGQQQLLLDGLRFNEELGTAASVPETVCFFGRKTPTPTSATLTLAAGGRWTAMSWGDTAAGDGTVPERSAVHPGAREKIPIAASHGDIYVNPALLEILQWELSDKYQAATRAAVSTERLTIVFNPDRDVYGPGEEIKLLARVRRSRDDAPVSGARIESQLVWERPLPAAPGQAPDRPVPAARLEESEEEAGSYAGGLRAPQQEGYYRLRAVVNVTGEPPTVLEELIAVEAPEGR